MDTHLMVTKAKETQALEETAWIRNKLGLPPDATSSDVYGEMHVLSAHANGYVTYIQAYKCDDKQGEIARLSVQVAELKAFVKSFLELADKVLGPSEQTHDTEHS